MNIKEESLKRALEATQSLELPRQMTSEETRFWIEAIILVRKQNATLSYAVAKHRGDGSINFTQDFGLMSPIAGVVSIHPYLYLDDAFVPDGDAEYLRHKIAGYYSNDPEKKERILNATEEELEFIKVEYAIEVQASSGSKTAFQQELARIAEAYETANPTFKVDEEEPEILVSGKRPSRKYTRRNGKNS